MSPFLDSLRRQDLSAATVQGYRYDLRHFLAWRHQTAEGDIVALERLTEHDLIAYRQAMIAAGKRPTTVNRRLDALRRLCRWAQGGGTLTIATGKEEFPAGSQAPADLPPGRYTSLTVQDTGCGMDEETARQAFEPFFSTKEFGQGTGLSLAAVYGIVHQSGGEITVCSEPGQGCTVRIYLPAAPIGAPAVSEPPPAAPREVWAASLSGEGQ